MYINASDYSFLTGRDGSEATVMRIKLACKLFDSRIGNHGTTSDGWKIDDSANTWYIDQYTALTEEQKEAIKIWVAKMIEILYVNGDSPAGVKNVKLGRFSVGNTADSSNQILSNEMGYYDSILVSSGLINRNVRMTRRDVERERYGV
jgi:hypothetical protein